MEADITAVSWSSYVICKSTAAVMTVFQSPAQYSIYIFSCHVGANLIWQQSMFQQTSLFRSGQHSHNVVMLCLIGPISHHFIQHFPFFWLWALIRPMVHVWVSCYHFSCAEIVVIVQVRTPQDTRTMFCGTTTSIPSTQLHLTSTAFLLHPSALRSQATRTLPTSMDSHMLWPISSILTESQM